MEQLSGESMDDLGGAEIKPINLSMPVIKNISAKWMVEMAEHISNNPQFIAKRFYLFRHHCGSGWCNRGI